MAVITQSKFDPLLSYVRVRLAQGVPIVDADDNEREDIDMFELRAFLKWFVGDGVPEGNDGFRIVESTTSKANNFTISSGFGTATDALANAGRCLVNGLDVMITANKEFTDQDLFETKPAVQLLEQKRKSPRILAGAMNAGTAGTLHVWLDVWDALVTPNDSPQDQSHMLQPGLGIESCSRDRRYFAVRVRTSSTAPTTLDAEFSPGHSYYRIAEIARRNGDPNVNQADITDLREQKLLVPPSTIIPDLFNRTRHGQTTEVNALDYRRGNGRPEISFRDAINALIRGEVPATPEIRLSTNPVSSNFSGRGTFFAPGAIVGAWVSTVAGGFQIFTGLIDLANPTAGLSMFPQPLTSNVDHPACHAVPLINGEALVAYEAQVAVNPEDVKLLRWVPRTGLASTGLAELDVATGTGRQRKPFCVPIGTTAANERVVVMWHDTSTNPANKWRFRFYQPSNHTFPTTAADLSPTTSNSQDLHAAKDAAGNIWIAFETANDIQVVTLTTGPIGATNPSNSPTAGGGATNVPTLSTAGIDKNPFVLVDGANVPWVFWVSTTTATPSNASIMYSRRATTDWSAPLPIPGLAPGINYMSNGPAAVIADDGAIWVFWDSRLNTTPQGNKDIWFARLDPVSGVWSGSRPTTGTADEDLNAFALSKPDGTIWLFWNRLTTVGPTAGMADFLFRRLITTL